MIKEIKNFLFARMDLDSASHFLKPNAHRRIWNSMLSVTRDQGFGYLIKVGGTTNAFTLAINADLVMAGGVVFKCIGVTEDVQRKCLIYDLCDTAGTNHSILRMFTDNYKLEWVIFGLSILNYQPKKFTDSNIVGDLRYWTDGYEGEPFVDYNPPRKVNLVKATAYYNAWSASIAYYVGQVVGYSGKAYRCIAEGGIGYSPITAPIGSNISPYWELANNAIYAPTADLEWFQILDRIKYPPTYAPNALYSNDSNNIDVSQ